MSLRPRLPRFFPLLSLVLAVSWGLSPKAMAQLPETPAETVPSAQPPAGVELSQITVEAEKAREALAELRSVAKPDPEIQQLEESFPEEEASVREELSKTNDRLGEGLSFRDMEDLSKRWSRELDRLERRLDLTRNRAAGLDEALATLQELRKNWSATVTDGQEALQNVVNEILELARTAEEELGTERTHLSEIRAPLRELRGSVDETLKAIEEARSSRGVTLSSADSPRLWEHAAWSTGLMDLRSNFEQNLHYMKLDLHEFVVDNAQRLLEHALVILLLIAALFSIRRRLTNSDIDEDQVSQHSRILENPVAAAFLLGLALMGEIYPQAPPVVMDIFVVLIFVPYLRVLPAGILKHTRRLLFSIWFLFILGRIEIFFPADSLILRFLLILQSVVGLVVFGLVARRRRGETPLLSKRLGSIAIIVVRLSTLALALSFISNLLGYIGLTRLLNTASINGAYAAILLFGLYQALRGLVQLLPHVALLNRSRMLQRHGALIQRRLTTLIQWLLTLWMIEIYLSQLGVKSVALAGFASVFDATAEFGELKLSLGGVVAFGLTLYAASLVSRLLRFVLEEDVYYRVYLPRGVPNAISTSLHYVVVSVGFILAIAATGVELSKLTILFGAFGVGIGFGLQDIVKNFVSGAVLLFERPIMPGDTIQTPQLWGQVKRIGIRSSTVRTWEGAEVIVPNSDLVLMQVTNWTLSDRQRRIEIDLGIAYGSDPTAVVQLLVEVAKANDEILESPNPYALFMGFGESSLDFSLRAWTVKFDDFLRIKSELTIAVNDALVQNGFEIPFPQRDVHLKSSQEDAKKKFRAQNEELGPREARPSRDLPAPDTSGPDDGSME